MFVSYAADARQAYADHGAYQGTGPAWASMHGLARSLRTRDEWESWLADWRRTELPLLASFIAPEFIDMFSHPDYDEYWHETDPANRLDRVEVPVLHEGGWFDRYVGTTLRNFNRIRGAGGPAAKAQRVIMGPWTHGGGVPADCGPATFGPAAHIDRLDLHRHWFDFWLRGEGSVDDLPPARLYLMGAERWVSSDTWPPPGSAAQRWYLRSGPSGSAASVNDGRLSVEEPAEEEPADEIDHDPYDPVPSIGGHGGVGWQWPAGPLDQAPAERRSLTYSSIPLEDDLVVLGEPVLRFHAASTAVDTDFVVTISDVFPDGHSAILRQNALRAAHRDGDDRARLLEPGRAYRYELTMAAIGNVFRRGHRIRVRISSSSFPALLPNPGTGEPLALATRAVCARNTVLHDRAHPSHLELPVLNGAIPGPS
jgi:putative CocE/NonD family hydrolase